MLLLAGCGSSSNSSSTGKELQKVGKGEGQLNLIDWPGYVADPWKSDFTKETGCKVNVKDAGTSDEMVSLMRTGQYDGVSASGNASLRLVDGGDVSPVNVSLIPNYATVFPDLKNQPYNTVDGVHYGIPHGRGANLLMWNSNDVKPAPDLLGRDARPEDRRQVQGQDQRLRRPGLHRRRRRLPQVPRQIAGDREPLRAEPGAVRRRGQPAQGAAPLRRRVLVRRDQTDQLVHQRRRRGRHHLAVPVLRAEGRRPAGGGEPGRARASCPRRARRAGRTPG